jgi:hypothetical protein
MLPEVMSRRSAMTLGSSGSPAVVLPRLAVVQADEQVTGANEVRVALGCEPIRAREFILEVRADAHDRLRDTRRGGPARADPPHRLSSCCAQDGVSS